MVSEAFASVQKNENCSGFGFWKSLDFHVTLDDAGE